MLACLQEGQETDTGGSAVHGIRACLRGVVAPTPGAVDTPPLRWRPTEGAETQQTCDCLQVFLECICNSRGPLPEEQLQVRLMAPGISSATEVAAELLRLLLSC